MILEQPEKQRKNESPSWSAVPGPDLSVSLAHSACLSLNTEIESQSQYTLISRSIYSEFIFLMKNFLLHSLEGHTLEKKIRNPKDPTNGHRIVYFEDRIPLPIRFRVCDSPSRSSVCDFRVCDHGCQDEIQRRGNVYPLILETI